MTALYCRLSRDDGNTGESMSIWSQKAMLKQYAEQNNIAIYDYYIDDGYSGTNFERPSFKKMITDIENGRINCVITKDLSRLGRNYLQSGAYIEMYFPQKNVRYIAITDGIDTSKSGETDIMPFKNILNEMYAKDTSKKVKSAIQSRMKEGTYIGSNAPFGFKKDPTDKHKLIIDEEVRYIIELIYKLCLEGKGTQLISQEMMERKIPRPSAFVENADKLYKLTEKNKYVWTHRMVLSILRDPVYCGNMARNKRPTLSFKNSKRLYVPKADYIFVKDTHDGTKACSSHRIEARDLYNIVLEDIQYHGQMALSSKEDLVEKIAERIDKDKFEERKNAIQKLKDSKDKLSELDKSFEKLYEDRLSESITERNFNMMNAKLSKKQDEILDEIHSLEEQIKMVTQKQENCEKFIENLSKYAKIKELNRYILNQVIDKIYVYDQEEVDGELKQ